MINPEDVTEGETSEAQMLAHIAARTVALPGQGWQATRGERGLDGNIHTFTAPVIGFTVGAGDPFVGIALTVDSDGVVRVVDSEDTIVWHPDATYSGGHDGAVRSVTQMVEHVEAHDARLRRVGHPVD